ncbi:uncharacterized protein FYW47_005296 [Aplochiton taeniatus]
MGMPGVLCVLAVLMFGWTPGCLGQRPLNLPQQQLAERQVQLAEKEVICHQEGCYAVFLQRRMFREAGRSCRERGGTLATVRSEAEADVVHQLLSSVEPQGSRVRFRLWIGLHRQPRQCSATRPLRGFSWVTGEQDTQYTNWLREEAPETCAAQRCVAMTVYIAENARESSDNFRWVDGSCGLPLDGFVCHFSYKGMCPPLEDEGGGPALYTTPFKLVSTLLSHVPYGSVANLPCPDPPSTAEQAVLCMEREDGTVGWSKDGPLCSPASAPPEPGRCADDHGCEHSCQPTENDYYCYCSEGYALGEDGYGCEPETASPPSQLEVATPTNRAHALGVCAAAGCEFDCVETARGVRCTCPPGYQVGPDGRACVDVDECRQQPCPQLCVNTPGTFHCDCHPGYQPDDEGECVDVDECLDDSSCEGQCVNTQGSFTCQCGRGFERASGGECVDVDECRGDSLCQQRCLNLRGGFRCYCDEGYDLQEDRHTCGPASEDEEYSTLTIDPGHDPNSDFNVKTYLDLNLDSEWLTEPPHQLTPDLDPPLTGSDDNMNQWDDLSPVRHHTPVPPTQYDRPHSQSPEEANASAGPGAGAGAGTEDKTGSGKGAESGRAEPGVGGDAVSRGGEADTRGKQKHDKSWLLVALLVPLCVFIVVMLALGIVYCTSCAVDQSRSVSDCCRWMFPAAPAQRRGGKPRA